MRPCGVPVVFEWDGVPFLQSLFVEERHWGMHVHCWTRNIFGKPGSGGRTEAPKTAPKPQRVAKPVENGLTRSPEIPLNEKASEHKSKTVSQTCLHKPTTGSEMETVWTGSKMVRKRFKNNSETGRNCFRTVFEPFRSLSRTLWVTCLLGYPFWNRSGTPLPTLSWTRVFWGTLFRTSSRTCSRNSRLTC